MALHFHHAPSVVNSKTLLRLKIGVRHDARHHYAKWECAMAPLALIQHDFL